MAGAAAHRNFCRTCGEYVRPGTHGIHEMRYGSGPRHPSAHDDFEGARAVAVVVTAIAGAGLAILLFAFWLSWVSNVNR